MKFLPLKTLSISILFFLFTQGVSAASVNIVTKYGDTGGIRGILNSVGDTYMGNDICPSSNTNSNLVPGCDMSSDAGYNDAGTPDDGSDDSYGGDLLVRTHDYFEVIAGWNWGNGGNDGEEKVTLTGTLPSGTGAQFPFEWTELPSFCLASESSISEDKQTITCVRENYDVNNVGSYSEDLPFAVRVRGGASNGEQPGDINFEISSLNAVTKNDDTNNTSIIVTASPRWGVKKSGPWNISGEEEFNGQRGVILTYIISLGVFEAVGGDTNNIIGLLGNESLGTGATISFTEDISSLSPNALLYDCSMSGTVLGRTSLPYHYFNDEYPERSIATPKDQVTFNCSQNNAGENFLIEFIGLDASLNHYPSQNRYPYSYSANTAIAAGVEIRMFVPFDDVKNGNNGIAGDADDNLLNTTNRLTDFVSLQSQSGKENFNGESEYLGDNSANFNIRGEATYHRKGVRKPERGFYFGVYPSYSEELTYGEKRHINLDFRNTGVFSLTGVTMCDVIDANFVDIVPLEITEYTSVRLMKMLDEYSSIDIRNGSSLTGFLIEYASSYVDDTWLPSNGGDISSRHGLENEAECQIENQPGNTIWYDTYSGAINAPNSIGAITKFRVRALSGTVLGYNQGFAVSVGSQFRKNRLDTGEIIPIGTRIKDFYTGYASASNRGTITATNILMGALVRINKEVDNSSPSIGDTVSFSLLGTLTNDDFLSGGKYPVIIKDILPPGLKYIQGSSSGALTRSGSMEPRYGTCAEVSELGAPCTSDHTVLVWDLGEREINVPIPSISYDTLVDASIPDGVSENWAMIESIGDNSGINLRSTNRNISISIPKSLLISKSLESNAEVYPNVSPGHFRVSVRNGSTTSLTKLDIIDVLPFNNDGNIGVPFTVANTPIIQYRNPSTAFSGSQNFQSLAFSGGCIGSPNYYYTNVSPQGINLAPSDESNTNISGNLTSLWCEGDENGPFISCGYSRNEVTAVRIRGPQVPQDATCSLDIFTEVSGNKGGNIYTNSAGAFADGVSNPVLSNDVSYRVIEPSILSLGGIVWNDTNDDALFGSGSEDLLSGVEIALFNSDTNTFIATGVTQSGAYLFSSLVQGNYNVVISASNFQSGGILEGYATSNDVLSVSDPNTDIVGDDNGFASGAIVLAEDISLTYNEEPTNDGDNDSNSNLTIDFGFNKRLSLGDFIWIDTDQDGIQDIGELGYSGATLRLLNASGTTIATTQTNSSGSYIFEDLLPGDYRVEIDIPNGYTLSPSGVGGSASDSDFDRSSGITQIISLTDDDMTVDGGIYIPRNLSLGGVIWFDEDDNAIFQTGSERTVANVELSLYVDINSNNIFDASDMLLYTGSTDGSGNYLFSDLAEGDYIVVVSESNFSSGAILEGYRSSNDLIISSDPDSDTRYDDNGVHKNNIIVSGAITLSDDSEPTNDGDNNDDTNLTLDFGVYRPLGSISGSVSEDTNNDEIGEEVLSGIEIQLFEDKNNDGIADSSTPVQTTITNTGGVYSFINLPYGSYVIKEIQPNGYENVGQNEGGDDDDQTTSIVTTNILTSVVDGSDANSVDTGNDFVERKTEEPRGSISGTVQEDIDGNDSGDTPLSGVELQLFEDTDRNGIADSTTPVQTTTTDSNGGYSFTNLPYGSYVIKEIQPNGYENVNQNEGGDDNDQTTNIVTTNILTSVVDGSDTNSVDTGNDFVERKIPKKGGSGSSGGISKPTPQPKPSSNPEPQDPEIPEVESPKEKPNTQKDLEVLYKDSVYNIVDDYKVKNIIVNKLDQLEMGDSALRALPKELPHTGTPISERVITSKESGVMTELPSHDTFRLAGNSTNDINFWMQVLDERDKDAKKYIVLPSNGLVMPINEFEEGSESFNSMINGREGNINVPLRTGALEYPGTSTRGYGETGNKVVFGHSSYWYKYAGRYKTHFQKIIELDVGEEIWIYEKQGDGEYAQYRYLTTESYDTVPTDTSVLLPGEGKNLTLFTCTPIGGISGRWIVRAKFMDDAFKKDVQEEFDSDSVPKKYREALLFFIQRTESIKNIEDRKKTYYNAYSKIDEALKGNYSNYAGRILKFLQLKIAQQIVDLESK